MGGVFRALRHEMGHPLYFGLDDADYTVLTRREAKVVGMLASFLMLLAQFAYVGMWGARGGKR